MWGKEGNCITSFNPSDNQLDFAHAQTLSQLLEKERQELDLSKNDEQTLNQLISRIFNPLKTRSSLLKELRRMPISSDFSKDHLIKLESMGYVVTLPDETLERVTITPEGIIALAYANHPFQDLKNLETLKCKRYTEYCYHQLTRLRKKELLKPKHTAILLFFLLNGSVGKENAYKVDSNEDIFCIERIVQSYITGSLSEVEKAYSLRYYLVEAKRILGNVIYNKSPFYYIEKNTEDYIISSVYQSIVTDPDFSLRWARLKKSYHDNITYMRARNNSFYSAKRELELDRQLLSNARLKKGGLQ